MEYALKAVAISHLRCADGVKGTTLSTGRQKILRIVAYVLSLVAIAQLERKTFLPCTMNDGIVMELSAMHFQLLKNEQGCPVKLLDALG